jgi:hypothetical protein
MESEIRLWDSRLFMNGIFNSNKKMKLGSVCEGIVPTEPYQTSQTPVASCNIHPGYTWINNE